MMDYPNYEPKTRSINIIKPLSVFESDTGVVQQLPKTTTFYREWELSYLLKPEEANEFVAFYGEKAGRVFSFTDVDGVPYSTIFKEPIHLTNIAPTLVEVTVSLREV